mgnify:FL=1
MPLLIRFNNIKEHREYRIVERKVFAEDGVTLIRTDVLAYVAGVWESLEGLTIHREKELLLTGTPRTRAIALFQDLVAQWKAEDNVTP